MDLHAYYFSFPCPSLLQHDESMSQREKCGKLAFLLSAKEDIANRDLTTANFMLCI